MRRFRFPVEAAHIALFARALGDRNPAFGRPDGGEVEGVETAPPTFVQAADHFDPEYDRRPRDDRAWYGSGREPIGAGEPPGDGGGRGFHAEQEFEYHRPVRPGETLTATVREGRRWEKEGRRGGTLRFTETVTEFTDEHGELVVTARFVGVGTEHLVS